MTGGTIHFLILTVYFANFIYSQPKSQATDVLLQAGHTEDQWAVLQLCNSVRGRHYYSDSSC